MEIKNIVNELSSNSYPGRGIVIGKTGDGKKNVIVYFIMGRSVNSRNRIFEENDCGGIRTKAFDESKMEDPSLIIYNPVLKFDDKTIVTNGDQTDTIYNFFAENKGFRCALSTRKFEPDEPNFTPRISGVLDKGGNYKLSILKSNMGNGNSCLRYFYEYEAVNGLGHFIHTYKCDGEPIPSFEGEPSPVKIDDDIDVFTNMIWKSLNEENKVSLFVRYIDIETRAEETRIINKNI